MQLARILPQQHPLQIVGPVFRVVEVGGGEIARQGGHDGIVCDQQIKRTRRAFAGYDQVEQLRNRSWQRVFTPGDRQLVPGRLDKRVAQAVIRLNRPFPACPPRDRRRGVEAAPHRAGDQSPGRA